MSVHIPIIRITRLRGVGQLHGVSVPKLLLFSLLFAMLVFSPLQNLVSHFENDEGESVSDELRIAQVLDIGLEEVCASAEGPTDLGSLSNAITAPSAFPDEGSDGDYYWMKLYNHGGSEAIDSIIEVSTGGYLLCGSIGSDVWVVRVDQDGSPLWNVTYDYPGSTYANNLIEANDGCFVIVGDHYNESKSAYDAFVLKIDTTGNHLWNKTYGGDSSDRGNDIIEIENEGFFIFGDSMSYGNAVEDFWLVRIDSNGNSLWNKTYGYASGRDYGYSLIESGTGDYILAGACNNISTNMGDIWLIWVDSDGVVQEELLYDAGLTECAYDLIECTNGDLVVTGVTYDWSTNWGYSIIMRINANGGFLWNSTYRLGEYANQAYSVIEMSTGGFVIGGESWLDSPNGYDAFICRYDDDGALSWNQTYRGGWSDAIYDLIEYESGGFLFVGETNGFGAFGYDGWMVLTPEPKWIDAPDEMEYELDTSYCYDLDATSAAGIDTWLANDSAFEIDGEGIITYTLTNLGAYSLLIWLNDTMGNSLTSEIDITVVDSLAPTWVVEPDDIVLEYGESFVYDLDAIDRAGIGRFWIEDTPWFIVDSAGIIRATEILSLGPYGIKVCVNDTNGNVASSIFIVTVEDTTAPTWIYAPHHIYVEYGDAVEFHLDAEDPFGISSWTISDTENFSISETGCIVSNELLDVGIYGLEVTVTDTNDNSQSESFNVIIQDTTSPTWLEEPMDQVLEYGQSLDYDIPIYDLSGLDACEIDDETNFDIEIGDNGLEGIITITNKVTLEPGVYDLSISVSDKYGNPICTKIHVIVIDVESGFTTETSTTSTTDGVPPTEPLILGVAVAGGGIAAVVIALILYKKFSSS